MQAIPHPQELNQMVHIHLILFHQACINSSLHIRMELFRQLKKYSRLIIEGSGQEFRKEIEKELGREIAAYQLGRAASSVKRVRVYIENILDNKFIADVSHGINHVKYNLEYGYQLMNLIERTRRTRQKKTQ
jgi:hypothetical protein